MVKIAWDFFKKHALGFMFGSCIAAATFLVGTNDYGLAMFFTGAAGFAAVVWCLTSPEIRALEDKADRPMALVGTFLILALTGTALYFIFGKREDFTLSQLREVLIPADDASPPDLCHAPKGALKLFVGSNTVWTDKFPHAVLVYKGKPQLVVDRNADGTVSISTEIHDVDGKLIATIDKNTFNITNHALATHKPRPDESTLVVYNESGGEVLNVRYLNRDAVKISAVFYFDGKRYALIPGNFNGSCVGGNPVDFEIP